MPIDFPICKSVIKLLINLGTFHVNETFQYTLEDLEHYDPKVHSSLRHIVDSEFTDEELEALMINFHVELVDGQGSII